MYINSLYNHKIQQTITKITAVLWKVSRVSYYRSIFYRGTGGTHPPLYKFRDRNVGHFPRSNQNNYYTSILNNGTAAEVILYYR